MKVYDNILGVEAANSSVKLAIGDTTDTYPNTCRELLPFEENTFGTNRTVFTYGGRSYVVGEEDAPSSGGNGSNRYDDQYKREMLFAIAKRVKDLSSVKIVTGVPAEHYKRPNLRDSISDLLVGEYEVQVNGIVKNFAIDSVTVMLQPLATVISYMMDNEGKFLPNRADLKNQKVLVIDVGFGTTDFCFLNKFNVSDFAGLNIGMLEAINRLEKLIVKEYPDIEGLPAGIELNAVVENKEVISCGGVEYQIGKLKEIAFSSVADEIMLGLRKKGFVVSEYDKVLFTGGGCLALRKYLRKYIEGNNATMLLGAQLANAKGYYKYGKNKF